MFSLGGQKMTVHSREDRSAWTAGAWALAVVGATGSSVQAADLYGAADYTPPPQASDYSFIDLKWAPWVTLAGNNTHVAGIDVTSSGPVGIVGGFDLGEDPDAVLLDNIVIEEVTVENSPEIDTASAVGIFLNANNARVIDSTITVETIGFPSTATSHGVFFGVGNHDILVARNTIMVDGPGDFESGVSLAAGIFGSPETSRVQVLDNTVTVGGATFAFGISLGGSDTSVEGASNDFLVRGNHVEATGLDARSLNFDIDSTGVRAIDNQLTATQVATDPSTPFEAAGIRFGENASLVELRNNAIDMTALRGTGIAVDDGANDVEIHGNTFDLAMFGGAAIEFEQNASTVRMSGNTIDLLAGSAHGIRFGDNASDIELWNNALAQTTFSGENGISFGLNAGLVRLRDNTVAMQTVAAGYGVAFASTADDVELTGNTIGVSELDADPVTFFEELAAATGVDVDIPPFPTEISSDLVGIGFNNGNTNVRIAGNVVSVAGDDVRGVAFLSNNQGVTLDGNTVTVVGEGGSTTAAVGAYFENNNFDVDVTGNAISVIGGVDQDVFGVRFDTDNTGLLLAGNMFGAIDGDVFHFAGTGNTLAAGSTGNSLAIGVEQDGDLCAAAIGSAVTGTLGIADHFGLLRSFGPDCTE